MAIVSVIIPAYNAEKFIKETIESVLSQTYQDFEIIVVNDGSKDNTEGIVSAFIKKYSNIQLINKTNSGVSDSRNRGLEIAKGKYIAFLDADDIWLPQNLEYKVQFLDNNKDVALVHAHTCTIDENNNPLDIVYIGKEGYILDSLLLWDGCNIPAPSSILLRTLVAKEINGWDASFSTAADQDFFFRIAARYKIGMIPQILTQYRILSNSMSRNIAVMEKDHIAVYNKAASLNLFKSLWFKRKCFSNLYLILAPTWWVDGGDKLKGLFFLAKGLMVYPPNSLKIIQKVFK